MLEFPFYSTIALAVIFLPVGIAVLILSIREWRYEYQRRSGPPVESLNVQNLNEQRTYPLQLGVAAVAGTAFTVVGGFMLFVGGGEIYSFRNIEVSRVAGLRIRRSEDEYHPSSFEVVEYTDKQKILEALLTLKTCSEIRPNHETFKDGYKIQLMFDDPAVDQYYLLAYTSSTASATRASVAPHFSSGRAVNLGDYQCPTFQNWLAENIDPLFENPPKRAQ